MLILVFLILFAPLASAQHVMTMTTHKTDRVNISIGGRGVAYIHWGYGSAIDTVALPARAALIQRSSRFDEHVRNISIYGDTITKLRVVANNLTALDVSRNPALENLYCSNNQLTVLDLSQNKALKILWCRDNHLTALDLRVNTELWDLDCVDNHLSAAALNAMFTTLAPVSRWTLRLSTQKPRLSFSGNPGAADCDTNILYKKGWRYE